MEHLLTALLAFPTVVFSVLLAVGILYWLLVIIGALDLDLFHVGDHDPGVDHAGVGHNPFVMIEFLRIGQVPITIIVSMFVLIAWILSLSATMLLRPVVPEWSWFGFATVTTAVAVVGAYLGTGFGCAPLAALFSLKGDHTAASLVGRVVEVTSTSVDARFGTARHDRITGEEVLLNVVCDPVHVFAKGDQAVIMEYVADQGVYLIAPLPHTRPDFVLATDPRPALPPPAAAGLPVAGVIPDAPPAPPSAPTPAPGPGRDPQSQ